KDNCVKNNSAMHFIGLFSDGNVHSNIAHLKAMLEQAKAEGVKKARIHILLDGRDVGETSALEYVEPFEEYLESLRSLNFDVKIASGGGRMNITMDRYEADWDMVRKGWEIHVLGKGREFSSAKEAIESYRAETNVVDQFMPGFVITEDNKPVGTIEDNDSVIFYNFRGDRAIEISKAFEDSNFDKFDRIRIPNVIYAGMLEYDGDLHIPKNYLVSPPFIKNTLGENLSKEGIKQYAISETQKFGHVTYFWNGNNSSKFKGETYVEVPSDNLPFEQRPWMQCAQITDKLIDALKSGEYKFLRTNFPNGDMVGHTGSFDAAVIGVESVDLCLARILPVVDQLNGVAIITADHGNADEMFETKKGAVSIDKKTGKPKPKTSHTLNKVPFIIYDNRKEKDYSLKDGEFGLANAASTVANLLGYAAPETWEESMIE
ncbi:MAG TPA: 2,3-bisphosphoglycerate-independent phosphoglycerate mutase, partial [Clostridia bacterium]|nr:2,3-bisphosphoglycerate-independent phosphoglycerate mutase [Clostridia bacterium]